MGWVLSTYGKRTRIPIRAIAYLTYDEAVVKLRCETCLSILKTTFRNRDLRHREGGLRMQTANSSTSLRFGRSDNEKVKSKTCGGDGSYFPTHAAMRPRHEWGTRMFVAIRAKYRGSSASLGMTFVYGRNDCFSIRILRNPHLRIEMWGTRICGGFRRGRVGLWTGWRTG
jgi:hypothetical protein